MPFFVEKDRKVLRVYAYFKEAVVESANEEFRVRKCVILYYLVDGTLQVEEPRIPNSGIPQGVFIKRHRVVKEQPGKLRYIQAYFPTTRIFFL